MELEDGNPNRFSRLLFRNRNVKRRGKFNVGDKNDNRVTRGRIENYELGMKN